MKKFNLSLAIFFISTLFISACSNRKDLSPIPTIDSKAKADLEAPIDCNHAASQIQVLESEKASVGKQILSGVRSIMPISAVVGILLGDYRDRVEVSTGQYNNDLEAKIGVIKAECGQS